MTRNKMIAVALALVAVLVPALIFAQVTSLPTLMYGKYVGNGPAPVLSSCGTAPAVAGTDSAGTITIGTGTPSACTVTFSAAWPNAPACVANNQTTIAKNPITAVSTTTAVVLTLTAASVNGDRIDYICVGR
jgi:hypothetical protein